METNTPEKLLEALTVEGSHIDEYKTQLGFGAAEIAENQKGTKLIWKRVWIMWTFPEQPTNRLRRLKT